VFIELCSDFSALHQHDYVHHDPKPANIMVQPDGTPVLIDWGSIQSIRPRGQWPMQYFTPDYACLDQIRGEALVSNDIYSLGKSLEATMLWPSRRLRAIIDRATAPIERRYTTAAQLQRDLIRLRRLDRTVNRLGLTAIVG
jgi:eukaryotic-like serine/threonine-protein kinase